MSTFRKPLTSLHERWPKRPKVITEWDHLIPHSVPEGLVLMARSYKNATAVQLYCEIDRACREEMRREAYPTCSLSVQDFVILLNLPAQKIRKAFALLSKYKFVVPWGAYSGGYGGGSSDLYTTCFYSDQPWFLENCTVKPKKGSK